MIYCKTVEKATECRVQALHPFKMKKEKKKKIKISLKVTKRKEKRERERERERERAKKEYKNEVDMLIKIGCKHESVYCTHPFLPWCIIMLQML